VKLEGVWKGQEYYPAQGIHHDVPYRIVQERGRFLLEAVSIGIGIGMQSCPVGFFGNDWQGVFSWDANAERLRSPCLGGDKQDALVRPSGGASCG
jgi:hypothetical protein